MKNFVVAAAAAFLAASAANAQPFPQPQSTVATQMTYKSTQYTITSGHTLTGISVPVTGRPIHLMVFCSLPDHIGVGSVTIVRVSGQFLEWVGTDIATNAEGTTTVEWGFNHLKGTHIVWADFDRLVDVEVESAAHIQITNNAGSDANVVVTMMY